MKRVARILVPLPSYGFDPTEAAVPWKILRQAGHRFVFATPSGKAAAADEIMISGRGLPLLLKGSFRAESHAVEVYRELARSPEFLSPITYAAMRAEEFDALFLVGGHDKGMREYLDASQVHAVIAGFFASNKPVAAICHGTLAVARSQVPDQAQGQRRSVLWGRKTTGLTRTQELFAYRLTRYKLGDYYRTYPDKDMPGKTVTMADEVISLLRSPSDFDPGPGWPLPLGRDSMSNPRAGFVVRDGNYLSARWPGDAHRLGTEFAGMLAE